MTLVERAKRELGSGRVPLDELIVRQKLSRTLDGYKSLSPAARAALQLQEQGRQPAPGQSMEFLFARNATGVHAWELSETLPSERLDTKRYCRLLDRAIRTVLDPCRPYLIPERLL
jgi:DNA polymerase elongation subunit (family B)